MANLRVMLARALNGSDLSHSDVHETALDRIAAFAFADPFGTALWRLKYAGENEVRPRCVFLLAKRRRSVTDEPALRWRLCGIVIDEWLDDACDTCEGRRFLMATNAEVMRVCPACEGTGVKRHSDQGRMRTLKWDPKIYRKWETRIALLHQSVADADARVWRQVAKQLGWIDPDRVLDNRAPQRKLRVVAHHSSGEQEDQRLEPALGTASGWA